jgi:hypothetical protein
MPPAMTEPSAIQLIIDGAVAVGTLAVAVLAIWGEWIRSKCAPVKLTLRLHTPAGDPTTANGFRLMYYHLRIVNERRWLPAANCRVLLKGLSRRGPDGQFHPVPMAVPLQFVWAPAEITPPVISVVNERILDFGWVSEDSHRFVPTLYSYANNFQGYVGANESVRYHLEIEATNFTTESYQVFETSWDGTWSHEPATMARHLIIREIISQ